MKHKFIFLLLLSSIVLFSCSKENPEIEPQTRSENVSFEEVQMTDAEFNSLLTRLYSYNEEIANLDTAANIQTRSISDWFVVAADVKGFYLGFKHGRENSKSKNIFKRGSTAGATALLWSVVHSISAAITYIFFTPPVDPMIDCCDLAKVSYTGYLGTTCFDNRIASEINTRNLNLAAKYSEAEQFAAIHNLLTINMTDKEFSSSDYYVYFDEEAADFITSDDFNVTAYDSMTNMTTQNIFTENLASRNDQIIKAYLQGLSQITTFGPASFGDYQIQQLAKRYLDEIAVLPTNDATKLAMQATVLVAPYSSSLWF